MKLTIALLITVILSGCSMYKTREFVQQEEVKIENWDIKVFMSAFSGSSSANWDMHDFTTFISIITYQPTNYSASINNFRLIQGQCPGKDQLELGLLKTKTYKNDNNRVTISPEAGTITIPENINHICAYIDASLISNSGNNLINKSNIQIGLERNESSYPFLSMF